MPKASYNPDHRGYTDLESLFQGNFDEGALHLELGKDDLPPKPKVIWDVQTGHRRLCPAEVKKVEDASSTVSTADSSGAASPVDTVGPIGAPGYRLSVARGPNPTARPLSSTAPGEFFAPFRRPPNVDLPGQGQRSEVLAAVNSMANEQQELIDSILEQCDKVSRMILLATANALRESNAKAQKPMPWMTARSHIKKELAQMAGMDEVHRLLDLHQLDHPENDDTLLYCSPEERNEKMQMESFFLQSVKKFSKNERIYDFDMERVQKRLQLHGKDAEGVLNYAGHDDSGKAAQRWFKQTEALAMAALKDHESGQHKIFSAFADTLSDTTRRMHRDAMGMTGFSMDTHGSEAAAPAPSAPSGGAVFLQPEEKDMLQGLEMQKKQKEKQIWELNRQLTELIEKRKKMDEDVAPQSSASERPDGGAQRLQHAKSLKEMDEALETLEGERLTARRAMEKAGPQMARMVDFMTNGQRNLRQLLDDLKRAEQKQQEARDDLSELVWPESRALVHDMVRNKEIAVELLDASILPVAPSHSPSSKQPADNENMSQVIADAKNVSNQQLVAAARKRQQLRQDKEAKEAELEERRSAAVAAKREAAAAEAAARGEVLLDEAEASLGVDTGLVKEVKQMCLHGNMLLSDLRHEQKDNHVEEVPHDVQHVMDGMKEAILKTSKVLGGKLDMDLVPSLTGEFEDVEIAVINLKMQGQGRAAERRGAFLKRSDKHVEEVLEEASLDEPLTPRSSASASSSKASSKRMQQMQEELQTNRAALAQLERRVQRMRVAVKQAESEAQSRGWQVPSMGDLSAISLDTQSSWPNTDPAGLTGRQTSGTSASAVATEEDSLSVGSEFDSDAEDLAPASTLQLPRKSSAAATVPAVSVLGAEGAKADAAVATGSGGPASAPSTAALPPAPAPGQARPRPDPIVTPSLSQAESVERKKSLRALKQAKLVHEGLQEDIAALRLEIAELQKSKGIEGDPLATVEARRQSVAHLDPLDRSQDRVPGVGPPGSPASASPRADEAPDAAIDSQAGRTTSGRFAMLVRSHSGKLFEGVKKTGLLGVALIGSAKGLDKQKRELTQQVKTLKQEVQKKKKLLMAMVPKDNLQDLINAGVFPGEQKTPTAQDNSVDKQVASLKNKLETLKKSVGFWQTRLENHVQKFNAMVEGPPDSKPPLGAAGAPGEGPSESEAASSQETWNPAATPGGSTAKWKSSLSRLKSSGTFSDLSDHLDFPAAVVTHHKSEPAAVGGFPSLQGAGLQVSAVGKRHTDHPSGPPKASDLLGKLRRAGGLVASMQRGGILNRSAQHASQQHHALHLGARRLSRDSNQSQPGMLPGAEGLADLVPEGHHLGPSSFADVAQHAVQSALEQEAPPSPKKELTRMKAFTALKREVKLLAFAAHARVTSKGRQGRELLDVSPEEDVPEPQNPTDRLEEHRPTELDNLEDSGDETDDSEVQGEDTPRTKLNNAMIKVKMTNYLRKAAHEVRQQAQKAAEEAAQARESQIPPTPRLSVTEYARNLTTAAGLAINEAERLVDMMRLLKDEFLPFVYQQLHDMLSLPMHEQKTALKMLSLGHVDVSSPMRSKGEGAKSLGIASLLATQLLAMKQSAGLWDERNIQASALLKTLELDQEADASGELIIEEPDDDENGQRLLSYYRRARPSMRGQKRRFVDASASKPFMGRSTVRRPQNKAAREANLELEGEHVDVHQRPALPAGPARGDQVDPLSIDFESTLDPEELAVLRRAQSWSLRPRKREELELQAAGSEGMRGYRRRASRELDNYDPDFWDDLQEKIRIKKTERFEEIQEQRREEWRKLGIEDGDESPRKSPSKTKALRGNFQFGGGRVKDTSRHIQLRRSNTSELNLDPQSAALRRRFWLGDLAEEPAEDFSSGSDNDEIKHSKSLGDLSPKFRRLSHKGAMVRTAGENPVDLSPRNLRGGLAARPMKSLQVAMNFAKIRRSPSPGGFVKLEGGVVKFATDTPFSPSAAATPRGFGMRGRSKERGLPSFHLDKKTKRGERDFRRGSSMFRRSFTAPGPATAPNSAAQRQEAMSLYERSLTRRLLGHGPREPNFSKSPAMRALMKKRKDKARAEPMARRMSQVRRGSLTHQLKQLQSFVQRSVGGAAPAAPAEEGFISVTHYLQRQPKGRLRRRRDAAPKPARVIWEDKLSDSENSRPIIQPKLDGWTKTGARPTLPGVPRVSSQEAISQVSLPLPAVTPAALPLNLAATKPTAPAASAAPVEETAPEAPVAPAAPGEQKGEAANLLDLAKKMPLLPPRKMAEIPVDEATARLRMNLMLFHRSRGDSPTLPATTPRPPPLPPMTTTPRGAPDVGPGPTGPVAPAGPAASPRQLPQMPQFSSLKGGFTPRDLGGMKWPQSARQNLGSRTQMDSNEVSLKAREMLSYLQSFDRAPLQRLLSSRDGPRAKTEPRRPSGEADAKSTELPPIAKEGGRGPSSQAAAWAQFLDERLGRHLRILSKSTPPPREVKSREIRSLLLD